MQQAAKPEPFAGMHMLQQHKIRVLYVTDKPFWRSDRGTSTALLHVLSWIKRNFHLNIFFADRINPEEKKLISGTGFDTVIFPAERLWHRRHESALVPDFDSYPQSLQCYIKPDMLKIFDIYLNMMPRYDVVVIDYLYAAWLLEAVRYRALKIVEAYDIYCFRPYKYGDLPEPIQLTFAEEGKLLDRFDAALIVEQHEYETAFSMCRHAIPVYCSCFLPVTHLPEPAGGIHFGYIGSGNVLNVQGVAWFLENVWPFQRNPQAILHIFGKICDKFSNVPDNVILHGFVQAESDAYAFCNVMINPTITGTGIKLKTLEAMACGRPIISSPEGAAGIPDAGGNGIWLARSRREFVDGMLRLGSDEALRDVYAQNGRKVISSHFSEDACMGALGRMIERYCDAS